MEDSNSYTEIECKALLTLIFDDVTTLYNEVSPSNWVDSPCVLFLHPTAEQQYKEHVSIADNLNKLSRKKEVHQKIYVIEEFKQDDLSKVSGFEEFVNILGLCVYDIFSNNHEVLGADNKVYDLGSMRGSGQFIAEFLNDRQESSRKYDYIDFYMGTIWIAERGDLSSFYEYIFYKLKSVKCDWKYSFPKLALIDLSKLKREDQSMETYNPEQAVTKELELTEKEKQVEKLQSELDKAYQEEYEVAKYKPLRPVVQAYKSVYGLLPPGHPQRER